MGGLWWLRDRANRQYAAIAAVQAVDGRVEIGEIRTERSEATGLGYRRQARITAPGYSESR